MVVMMARMPTKHNTAFLMSRLIARVWLLQSTCIFALGDQLFWFTFIRVTLKKVDFFA
jgi:hypothetical protein